MSRSRIRCSGSFERRLYYLSATIVGNQKYVRTDWSFVGLSLSISADQHVRLPFKPFHPHFCSYELLCPMANCSCGLVRLSSSRCHRLLGCGALGSTLSSVASSGCILSSISSKTGTPGILPFSISGKHRHPVTRTCLGGDQVGESSESATSMVLAGEVRLCRMVWL